MLNITFIRCRAGSILAAISGFVTAVLSFELNFDFFAMRLWSLRVSDTSCTQLREVIWKFEDID